MARRPNWRAANIPGRIHSHQLVDTSSARKCRCRRRCGCHLCFRFRPRCHRCHFRARDTSGRWRAGRALARSRRARERAGRARERAIRPEGVTRRLEEERPHGAIANNVRRDSTQKARPAGRDRNYGVSHEERRKKQISKRIRRNNTSKTILVPQPKFVPRVQQQFPLPRRKYATPGKGV